MDDLESKTFNFNESTNIKLNRGQDFKKTNNNIKELEKEFRSNRNERIPTKFKEIIDKLGEDAPGLFFNENPDINTVFTKMNNLKKFKDPNLTDKTFYIDEVDKSFIGSFEKSGINSLLAKVGEGDSGYPDVENDYEVTADKRLLLKGENIGLKLDRDFDRLGSLVFTDESVIAQTETELVKGNTLIHVERTPEGTTKLLSLDIKTGLGTVITKNQGSMKS